MDDSEYVTPDPNILDRLIDALSADGGSGQYFVAIALIPAISALFFALVLLGFLRSSSRRTKELEGRLARLESGESATAGPTVREFCRELIESLRLRLPKAGVPEVPPAYEADFVRGLVTHLRARRRHRVAFEKTFEEAARELASTREEINYIKLRLEAIANAAMNPAPLANASDPMPSDSPVETSEEEFSAILSDAAAALDSQESDESGDVLEDATAPDRAFDPQAVEQSAGETGIIAEVQSAPGTEDESIEALTLTQRSSSEACPPATAECDGSVVEITGESNRLSELIEQSRIQIACLDEVRELTIRAGSIADAMKILMNQFEEREAQSASLIDRMDHRLEEMDRRSRELTASSDVVRIPEATDVPAMDHFPVDPIQSEVNVESASTASASPCPADELMLDCLSGSLSEGAESLKGVIADAIIEGQRLTETRDGAEHTRAMLSELDAALSGQLTGRQALLDRIDSQLRERQIQLVTDIMRAQAEHLAVTKALQEAAASVDGVQSLINDALPEMNESPLTGVAPTTDVADNLS